MELTIDQLAQRVDMSTRNIREWQRLGLLAKPVRRGRVGIYAAEHVARIERVKQLHADGLPLDLIRRLSEKATGSEADVRHLADEVLNPFTALGSATLTKLELVDRLGDDAFAALASIGLVAEGERDTVTVRDLDTLNLIQELSKVGISPQRLTKALAEVQYHQREIARLVIDVVNDDVWRPFASSGFTTRDWGSVADDVARIKPLVVRLLAHLLDAAVDDIAASVVVREASALEP